jgi:nicotinamide riboside transporter PnuC
MFFSNIVSSIIMFYSVELQMAGVILLTAMAVGGISLWLKRRKIEKETSESVEEDISENL